MGLALRLEGKSGEAQPAAGSPDWFGRRCGGGSTTGAARGDKGERPHYESENHIHFCYEGKAEGEAA
jgi:hypothetical protein